MQSLSKFRTPVSNKSLGIEIECLVLNDWHYDNSDKHHGFFYATTDGSIQAPWGKKGQEFVSQPLTKDWLKKEINKLSKKVVWEHNSSCGIHIHVSRKWLSVKKAKALYLWMCSLTGEDVNVLFGRVGNTYCRYTTGSWEQSRYCAINTTNKETIEFRMFASGDVKWAQYCVDMADYLVRNANHINVEAARAFHDMYYPN